MAIGPAFSELPSDEEYEETEVETSQSTNAGRNSAAEQGQSVPMAWKPTAAKPLPVIRCTAIKTDGEQCKKWSLRGANVCIRHGGQLPGVRKHAEEVREAARLRILGLADVAIDTIEELVGNPTTAGAVRLKAATELLDRAGVKGGADITVDVEVRTAPSEEIAKRLAGIAARLAPKPVEEEIVDLGETEEPESSDEEQG